MIKNERQYIITKAQVRKFKAALARSDKQKTDVHPTLVTAQKRCDEKPAYRDRGAGEGI
ncbi:MAG: hypothetical protein GQ559_03215 [Desulfobulbaceae bacterium]|nr:hypothetical protein [Desulfobulbaceae bacterium]